MKRGYTLIEILAVIIILGIVIAISIPIVGTLIRNSQEDAFRENQNALIEAAKTYQHGLPGYLSQLPNEIIFLSLKELKVTNHIEDIVDPKQRFLVMKMHQVLQLKELVKVILFMNHI